MGEDLRQPLRRRGLRDHLRGLRPSPLRAASLIVGFGALGLGVWLASAPAPLTGEPVVHVLIEAADPIATGTTDKTDATEARRDDVEPTPDDVAADQELAEESTASSDATSPSPLAPAPIKALSESGRFGTLPRIAANGRKPWEAYARPVSSSELRSDGPKIAIVLGGMGINEALTRRAIKELPAGVTLAFAPYGKNVQKLVNEARARGHEVLLHLPMEPFGYPAVDPGPRTLLAGAGAAQNLDNLHWLMSRFTGYAGVVNYMGARFTGERPAFEPVVAELGRRGLVYLDDGSSARSLVGELGAEAQLPVRKAERLIDSSGGFGVTLNNLRAAEIDAARSGIVVVIGSGLAETIEAVQSWGRGAAERGVQLVPASAAFRADAG